MCAQHRAAPLAFDRDDRPFHDAARRGLLRMKLDRRLGTMAGEARRLPGAGHRMPLVPQAAGIEPQWALDTRRMHRRAWHRRNETRTAVGVEERAVAEEALPAPDERRQHVVGPVVDRGMSADVEVAPTLVLESRERRVLAKNVGLPFPGEGLAEAEATRDLAHDSPVLPGLARRGQERTLARDDALGVGDGAVLLRPG